MSFFQSIKFWLAKGVAEILGAMAVVAVLVVIVFVVGTIIDWRGRK